VTKQMAVILNKVKNLNLYADFRNLVLESIFGGMTGNQN